MKIEDAKIEVNQLNLGANARIGRGTKIKINGEHLKGVYSFELSIPVDDLITIKIGRFLLNDQGKIQLTEDRKDVQKETRTFYLTSLLALDFEAFEVESHQPTTAEEHVQEVFQQVKRREGLIQDE